MIADLLDILINLFQKDFCESKSVNYFLHFLLFYSFFVIPCSIDIFMATLKKKATRRCFFIFILQVIPAAALSTALVLQILPDFFTSEANSAGPGGGYFYYPIFLLSLIAVPVGYIIGLFICFGYIKNKINEVTYRNNRFNTFNTANNPFPYYTYYSQQNNDNTTSNHKQK